MVVQYAEDSIKCRYVAMFDRTGKETYHVGMHMTSETDYTLLPGCTAIIYTGEKFWIPDEMMIEVYSCVDEAQLLSWSNRGLDGFTVTMMNKSNGPILIHQGDIFCDVRFRLLKNTFNSQQVWLNLYCYPRKEDTFLDSMHLKPCRLEQ